MQTFIQSYKDSITHGQSEFERILKTILNKEISNDFNQFKNNHKVYTEPLLFALINGVPSPLQLEQIIFGYQEIQNRPKSLKLYFGKDELAYLPNHGYIKSKIKDAYAFANIQNGEITSISLNNHSVDFDFLPLHKICNNDFEIQVNECPVLNHLIEQQDDKKYILKQVTEKALETLKSALIQIQKLQPELYWAFKLTTKKFYLFHSDQYRSMATTSAHGVCFINVAEKSEEDIIFFLEDIAHQCGHVSYYAQTIDKQAYFTINPEVVTMTDLGNEGDLRNIYQAFHGLFTYTTIFSTLIAYAKSKTLTENEEFSFKGRLAFFLRKFTLDIQLFNHREIFTEEGWNYYQFFTSKHHEFINEYAPTIEHFDLSSQPYIFDLELFKAKNAKALV